MLTELKALKFITGGCTCRCRWVNNDDHCRELGWVTVGFAVDRSNCSALCAMYRRDVVLIAICN